jgi:GNAT superfamily N-acetyltransferase
VTPAELRAEVDGFAQTLRDEYGAELWMVVKADGDQYEFPIVSIESVVIAQDERDAGKGTALMGELAGWANRNNLILSLHPSSDFGGAVTRLRRFYRRFGFVPNKGRNKDFRTRDAMIRLPRKQADNPPSMALKRKLMR